MLTPVDPKYEKKKRYFFHILDLNLKSSYEIAPLFYMDIDLGGGIAGNQDRPSLGIEGPPQGPSNSQTL